MEPLAAVRPASNAHASPLEGEAISGDTVVVRDVTELDRVDELWPSLLHRRTVRRVELGTVSGPSDDIAAVENGINAALQECGCDQGAVGVITFTVLAAIGLRMVRRDAVRTRSRATSLSRDLSLLVGASVAGGVLGKLAGLQAARFRFLRLRSRLEKLLTPQAIE